MRGKPYNNINNIKDNSNDQHNFEHVVPYFWNMRLVHDKVNSPN